MEYDVVIVGSGLAGLSVALRLPQDQKIAILCKRTFWECSSNLAQGGIAAVLDPVLDSTDRHFDDTLTAGAGLCDEGATKFIVEHGGEAIDWLIDQGVPFSRDADKQSDYHLTREGGHSQRRIFHAADATGHVVQETLEKVIRQPRTESIFETVPAPFILRGERLCPDAEIVSEIKKNIITKRTKKTGKTENTRLRAIQAQTRDLRKCGLPD